MNCCRLLVPAVATLLGAAPILPASTLSAASTPVQMVITAVPADGAGAVERLGPSDLSVLQDDHPVQVASLQPLTGAMSAEQLVVLLDDSSRSSSLTLHFSELAKFLESLPGTTQVAVGYMRNGSPQFVQSFTADHSLAAKSLRVPLAVPGLNGSPYFALSDLLRHWPSKQHVPRRAVLMLTDGVDRYFGTSTLDDPYVDAAIRDAAREGVAVYSIYLRGAGFYGRGDWTTDFAQSRLVQIAQQSGGHAYFEDFTDPVTIKPFLDDFSQRLANQYLLTVTGLRGNGFLSIKVRSSLPETRITAPERLYVP